MKKISKYLALYSTLAWIIFIFSAFKGFHFWYAGFLFFFWLSLSAINYRHETSLWLFYNRFRLFLKFFLTLGVIGFIADYIIGIKIAHLWTYFYYNSIFDWFRLYIIIYPFGGLVILELVFFLVSLFNEKFVYLQCISAGARLIDASDHFVDMYLLAVIIGIPLLHFLNWKLPFNYFFVYGFLVWIAVATVKFVYHIRHVGHWLIILGSTLFMSLLLNEFPNTVAGEWTYFNAPILNYSVFEIPAWVILGWYVMILFMLRLWVRFVWSRKPHFLSSK